MQPFCCDCRVFMKPAHNGAVVETRDGNGQPYQLMSGDEYRCPKCNYRVISGFGQPVDRHDSRWDYFATRAKSSKHFYGDQS